MEIKELLRDNIRRLAPYSCARDEFKGEASVYLDANESPYDNGTNRYPDPLQSEVKTLLYPIKKVRPSQIFLGPYSPESAGDYASGTNHTLPTNGYAKAYNGVNLDSYMRKVTFQEISREGLRDLGPVIETMATAEQLDAHRNAVTVRLANI